MAVEQEKDPAAAVEKLNGLTYSLTMQKIGDKSYFGNGGFSGTIYPLEPWNKALFATGNYSAEIRAELPIGSTESIKSALKDLGFDAEKKLGRAWEDFYTISDEKHVIFYKKGISKLLELGVKSPALDALRESEQGKIAAQR